MHSTKRRVKNALKLALHKLFVHGQRFGFDMLPRHFYSEIPDLRQLKSDAQWKAPYSMRGIRGADTESQLTFLKECCTPSIIEEIKMKNIHAYASRKNGEAGFGPIEADFLYAFVATKKPKQIFQIGCGVSTAVCLLAAQSSGYTPEVICVELSPTHYLVQEAAAGRIELVGQKAEFLDQTIVEKLGADVLFFVDSSHTLGPAGEVSRIILEMLPRLKAGAWVHFHDITFPYDYDRHILDSALFFQHESILLHAFLAYSSKFRLAVSLSLLHYFAPAVMGAYLPHYKPAGDDEGLEKSEGHFPSSTYLEVME